MKVLIFSHNYPNSVQIMKGVFVAEQVRFLASKCEIKVIAPVPYAPPFKSNKKWDSLRSINEVEIYDNMEIYHPKYILLPKKILYNFAGYFMYFGVLRTVKKLLKNWNFDIIHAHFSFPDGFTCMKIAKKYDKILIATEHLGIFDEMLKNRLWKSMNKKVFEESKKIFVVSPNLRKSIESINIDVSKICELHNGIDINKFVGAKPKSESKFQLIAIGNFVPIKGFMILLRATKILIQKGWDIELTLIGDGILKDDYVNFINHHGLSKFIKLTGYLHNDRIAEYLQNSHICISSSLKESFGITIIEAFACGLPVVVTNSGGPNRFVNNFSGIVVERNNVTALSDGIISIMKNYSQYSRKEIREYCLNNFDFDMITNKIIDVYQKVLHEKRISS